MSQMSSLTSQIDNLLQLVDAMGNPLETSPESPPQPPKQEVSPPKPPSKPPKKTTEQKTTADDMDDSVCVVDEDTHLMLKTPRGTRDYDPGEMAIRHRMMDAVKKNFDRCGGQYMETPVFELREILMDKYGEEEKLIYELEDQSSSEMLCLRYDLTVPLARYVAMNRKHIKNPFKAARVGRVYRRDQPRMTKGRYREFWQCDFDIVRTSMPTNALDLIFDDVEIIGLMYQILSDLNFGKFVLRINNRKLLDVILDICGVTSEKVRPISSAIDKMDKRDWDEIKAEMVEKGISAESAELIREFVTIRGTPQSVLQQLTDNEKIVNCTLKDKATEALNELQLLIQILAEYNSDALQSLELDMSMVRGLDYYTGVILEAQFADKTLASEIGSIAGGGRYDRLVSGFIPSQDFPCVGASIGFERIFSYLKEKFGTKSGSNTSVLVCELNFKDGPKMGLYKERLQLLQQLRLGENWNVETIGKLCPSFRDQINFAEDRDIQWMIIIGEDEIKNNTVNLRRLTLVGDRIVIKSKDKTRNGKTGVIVRIEHPENAKFPFFYIRPDEGQMIAAPKKKKKGGGNSSNEWRMTKKEIGQVICNNEEETVVDLQIKDMPRDELVAFLRKCKVGC